MRYIHEITAKFLADKMVFIAGPRQTGKTTLSKELLKQSKGQNTYWNWDDPIDQEKILRREFPISKSTTKEDFIVFDELHKYARWRNYLKGFFDKHQEEFKILVTGSARLDHYRKSGDSLQGRYYSLRLHPLSFAELKNDSPETIRSLLKFGGFPEPFFAQSEDKSRIWSRTYRTRVIREDLANLEQVKEISLLEQLSIRLPECVGSPLSVNNLRQDIGVAHKTVSRWLDHLENLYTIFRIYPFSAPKIKAVKKEAKHYHFDWTLIEDQGHRFENLIACHLLKWCHFVEDTQGYEMDLRFFKDDDGREVDFVITKNRKPIHFIEVKVADKNAATALKHLSKKFPNVRATQVLLEGDHAFKTPDGIEVISAHRFLSEFV